MTTDTEASPKEATSTKRKSPSRSPETRKKQKSDSSPPRKSQKNDNTPPGKSQKGDNSPPRKSQKGDNYSPPRKSQRSDSSPPKKSQKSDNSPTRQSRKSPDSDKRRKKRSRSRSRERGGRRRYHDYDQPVEDYPRYYGDDKEEKRNSDKYWTKYPKKDENQVGDRYYGSAGPPSDSKKDEKEYAKKASEVKAKEKKTVDLLTRTGGAYIPPAKLRMMQAEITDKTSTAYQRIAWEALKKSIHGFINKVNTSNIGIISKEILHENIVRGRGLLCKSLIQAQAASPTFTNVYAALVAVINSKFPNIGELLLKRLVLQFKRGFKQNNKTICISATTFVAHLVNQRVAHEILALEILTLLVESPTDDSVEVAISFLKECGQKLTEVSSKGINAIFEMLRNILHEGRLEQRIQYMIEVMFQVRKDGFKDHAAVIEALDLVEEEDQFTHLITLDDVRQTNSEETLNVFKFDDNYEENEGKYISLRKEILDSDSDSEPGSGSDAEEGDEDDDDDEENEETTEGKEAIIDNTETNLIALRRTIYLTIQSSLDFEECAHKLMKMELKPGQEIELCHMFLDCCAEQRTYEKFYGLLAQRFCQVNNVYVEPFQQIFKDTYSTTHRLDTGKLRNVGKFFAHLMFTDAISWEVLEIMKLNEEDTNSSTRIFIKVLFQELAEYMGLERLNARLKDPTLQEHFAGLFPRDNPKNTRFSINFFTSIGLGGLTAELREHLKNAPKVVPQIQVDNSSSSDSSSEESSSEDDGSSETESSSDDEKKKKKNRNKKEERNEENERRNKERRRTKSESKSRERNEKRGRKEREKRPENTSGRNRDDRKYRRNEENKSDKRGEHYRPREEKDDRRTDRGDRRRERHK